MDSSVAYTTVITGIEREITRQPKAPGKPTTAPTSSVEASMKRRRVLFVIHTPADQNTAVYKNTLMRAKHLEETGFSCTVLSPTEFPLTRRCSGRFIPFIYPLEVAAWLFVHTKAYDIVVFHSYAGWLLISLSRFVPRLARLHTVIQFHGLEPLYFAKQKEEAQRGNQPLSWRYRFVQGKLMTFALRHACRHADRVFCLNKQESHFLTENHWARPGCTRVVANPVPSSFFFERRHRERATRLLFVGQWLGMKGTRYLAEAFRQLRSKHTDLHLVCAGTLASCEAVLKDFAVEVRDYVEVVPRLGASEMVRVYEPCDLFVFPTLSEGFSLALIEAAASGMPIVTTPVGAAPDILENEVSTIFCTPHDANALRIAIEGLLDARTRREQLGRNAQEAATRFREESVLSAYETLLCELQRNAAEASLIRQ